MNKPKVTQTFISMHASDNIKELRARHFNRYMEKYRAIWLGAYKIGGIPLSTAQYIMEKFWETGTIAGFMRGNESVSILSFCPWSGAYVNFYRNPSRVNLVPENGIYKGVSYQSLEVIYDPEFQTIASPLKSVVLGYAQANRESIQAVCRDYVAQIVGIEMTIHTALNGAKLPWVMSVNSDTRAKAEVLMSRLEEDDPCLFVDGEIPQGLINGSPYIIDKLYQYKQQKENELLTYLGIDNVAIEKKERTNLDEVNSNNDLINTSGASINQNLESFIDLINKVFGQTLTIEATNKPVTSVNESPKGEKNNDNDNDK